MDWLKKIVRFIGLQNLGFIFSISLMLGYMGWRFDYFLSVGNLEVLGKNFVLEAIMALGMTLVIISGGIDLSVGAVLLFSAICVGMLLCAGMAPWLAVVLALGAATMVGLLNAGMTILLKVHPFIVTLATMLTLQGVNLTLLSKGEIALFPESFAFIGQGRVLGLPVPLVLFAALALILGLCLKNHRFFQQVYFIGGNPRAARISGIKTDRFLFFVYGLSAFLAGVAGVIVASKYGNANSTFGQNVELKVITAVVIGGASLNGGTGSIFSTVLGVFFLAIVYNAFVQFENISPYWEEVVTGVLLLLAVGLGEFMKRGRIRRKKNDKEIQNKICANKGEMT